MESSSFQMGTGARGRRRGRQNPVRPLAYGQKSQPELGPKIAVGCSISDVSSMDSSSLSYLGCRWRDGRPPVNSKNQKCISVVGAPRASSSKRRKSGQTSSAKIDFWVDLLRRNSAGKFGNSPRGFPSQARARASRRGRGPPPRGAWAP